VGISVSIALFLNMVCSLYLYTVIHLILLLPFLSVNPSLNFKHVWFGFFFFFLFFFSLCGLIIFFLLGFIVMFGNNDWGLIGRC
jgi:hypothetical protein